MGSRWFSRCQPGGWTLALALPRACLRSLSSYHPVMQTTQQNPQNSSCEYVAVLCSFSQIVLCLLTHMCDRATRRSTLSLPGYHIKSVVPRCYLTRPPHVHTKKCGSYTIEKMESLELLTT
jgi:hypothetical protein